VTELTSTTVQGLLRQAVDRLGEQELALRLAVPVALVQGWIAGRGTVPLNALSVLVDLLAEPGGP
jgi:hypothetical protein